ncbi:hypothetical protein [Alicyclobacillus fodiniaquatilis]|uniref:Uncharacterized protein n=1 Tax=Alicyclobacillus fodiniaquatilis TaxID=1661150 RepID=A0ABW4JGY9_9BACL
MNETFGVQSDEGKFYNKASVSVYMRWFDEETDFRYAGDFFIVNRMRSNGKLDRASKAVWLMEYQIGKPTAYYVSTGEILKVVLSIATNAG